LHSDGSIYRVREFWPTRELAQAVLDKWQHEHDEWQQVVETAHAAIKARTVRQVAAMVAREIRIEARTTRLAADARDALEAIRARKPEHVWVHGDVFMAKTRDQGQQAMIYLNPSPHALSVIFLHPNGKNWASHAVSRYLKDATFLFNIREKL